MIGNDNRVMMGKKTGLILGIVSALYFAVNESANSAPSLATAADLKPVRSNVIVITRQHFCLDAKTTGIKNGTKVQFVPCHGLASQRWTLTKGGFLVRYGRRVRKCLSVPATLLRKGTALRLWDCKNVVGQRWFYKKGRLFLFFPKKGLCVTTRSTRAGRNEITAVLGPCAGKAGLVLKVMSKMPLPLKPVQLRAKNPALCIDKTAGLKNGVMIELQKCRREHKYQQFKLEKKRGEHIQIQSTHSGKCLSVADASKKTGAIIQQWSCLGYDNQLWIKVDYPRGWFALKAKHSGHCLTAVRNKKRKTASLRQNTSLRQTKCKGPNAAHQLFKMSR